MVLLYFLKASASFWGRNKKLAVANQNYLGRKNALL
jgi:hypothetical protein